MNDVAGAIGELRFTLEVTRKDGKKEQFEMVGSTTLTEEQLKQELLNGNHAQRGS